jgi:hypothetical protein
MFRPVSVRHCAKRIFANNQRQSCAVPASLFFAFPHFLRGGRNATPSDVGQPVQRLFSLQPAFSHQLVSCSLLLASSAFQYFSFSAFVF